MLYYVWDRRCSSLLLRVLVLIKRRLVTSLVLPCLAWSGFLQSSVVANSNGTVVEGSETRLRIFQTREDIRQNWPSGHYTNHLLSLSPEQANVEPFQPNCQASDNLCTIWTEFRLPHPYPTQRIAAKIISDDEMVLIISEPPDSLDKQQWKELIESIFSTDLLEYKTFKWMIGLDGWVEDIVLRVKKTNVSQGEDLLSDSLTRDRISLLNIAMFGSSMGANVESIEPFQPSNDITRIPNLRLSAGEALEWFTNRDAKWQTLNNPNYAANHWLDQASIGTRQVQISSDQTLILLTFPLSDIVNVRRTEELPEELKIAFREFAVSSDIMLSGAWSDDQVAILARTRQVPMEDFPPLRVETFELIAAQKTSELYQSYERTNLFAGKLSVGEYVLRDWAPILLSPALINTEFGALLNITDQMLKSWSQAGQTEYIYFDYPNKPNIFPFNGTPLNEVVFAQTGSQQVLFNWNTTGMGSVISGDPSILIPTQTGSLPITYGSELDQAGELQTGHLQQYEAEAYNYFANLQDPNLATVVQYTLLYQLMLAAVPVAVDAHSSELTPGSQVLTNYALEFIRRLDTTTSDDLANARDLLSAFREKYPNIDNQQLATLLADPTSSQIQSGPINEYNSLVTEINTKVDSLQNVIDEYNAKVDDSQNAIDEHNTIVDKIRQGIATPGELARIEQLRTSIDVDERELNRLRNDVEQQENELERLQQRLDALDTSIDETITASNSLSSEAQQLILKLKEFVDPNNLDRARIDYSGAYSVSPDSWIKTPASVLSWPNERGHLSLSSVGGHNLDSQTLRFEESSGISNLRVIETESGPVLQYPSGQRTGVLANAAELARQVEHRGITDPQALSRLLQQGQAVSRPRRQALEISSDSPYLSPISNPNTGELVTELQDLVGTNNCCRFVVNDNNGIAYVASTNPSPPPVARIIGYGDTPSLFQALDSRSDSSFDSNRPIVILDGVERANAIARSLSANNPSPNPSPSGRMQWLTNLAQLINIPIKSPQSGHQPRAITVLKYGRNNNLGSLQVSLADGGDVRVAVDQVVDGLSAQIQPDTVGVQEVLSPVPDLQLPPRWQQAADQGKLAIINFSYAEQGALNTSANVYISSPVNESSQVATVRTEMANAATNVVMAGIDQETTTFDVLTDIRNQIEEQLELLPEDQVEMILERSQDTYYITDNNQSDSGS